MGCPIVAGAALSAGAVARLAVEDTLDKALKKKVDDTVATLWTQAVDIHLKGKDGSRQCALPHERRGSCRDGILLGPSRYYRAA